MVIVIQICWSASYAQQELRSGLYFNSHEVIQDLRTSLDITPEEPLKIKGKLDLSFDIRFRKGDGFYGYIFKMLGDDRIPIDLVSNLASEKENFWLVVGEQSVLSFYWSELGGPIYNEWTQLKMTFDPVTGEFTLSINGIEKKVILPEFKELHEFKLVYGASQVPNMLNSDVCPMTLKNVRIADSEEIIRKWELKKHGKEHVFDEIKGVAAAVNFPNWEIDKHVYWEKTSSYVLPQILGVTSTESSDSIFLVGLDELLIFNPSSKQIQNFSYSFGNPYPCLENNLIYNPNTKEIWSYSFDNTDINKLDLKTFRWSAEPDTCPEPDLWHHNKIFDRSKNELITFGGYGHYTYKSDLHRLIDGSAAWDSINKSASIHPRYLSSIGKIDEKNYLIFGGFGSPTGNQGINPQHYFDLYALSIDNETIEKIRDIKGISTAFTPVSQGIVSNDKSRFYTLMFNNINYNTHLKLVEIGINEDEFKIFQDSIAFDFLDTKSWATLYQNDSKLIAITRTDSLVDFYQLAYPPLLIEESFQPNQLKAGWHKVLFILLPVLIVLIAAWFLLKKKNKKPLPPYHSIPNDNPYLFATKNNTKASIILMGGFQIFDSEGEDITGLFTPTLKQLFILIYLSSILDKKGISSEMLTELLWSDKSATSARNNRNVNLSKIRLILEKVSPTLQLTHDNSFWKIEHDGMVYSDVLDAQYLIEKIKTNPNLDSEDLDRLLKNSAKGGICPSIQTDWMDQFKADFTSQLLDALLELIQDKKDHQLIAKISDSILKFDPLNDEALRMKCYSLFKLGKKSQALAAYNQFCKDYSNLLGQEFDLDFNDLLESS